MSESEYMDLVAVDDVPEKGFIVRQAGGVQVVICRFKDGIHVVENKCSHAFSPFDGGQLRGNRLFCPLHGACFDVCTGKPLGKPAFRPIRCFPVRIEGDRVLVDSAGEAD